MHNPRSLKLNIVQTGNISESLPSFCNAPCTALIRTCLYDKQRLYAKGDYYVVVLDILTTDLSL